MITVFFLESCLPLPLVNKPNRYRKHPEDDVTHRNPYKTGCSLVSSIPKEADNNHGYHRQGVSVYYVHEAE